MARTYKEWFEYELGESLVLVKVTITPGSFNMWGHPDDMEPNDPDEWEMDIESVDGIDYKEWGGVIPKEDLQIIEKISEDMV